MADNKITEYNSHAAPATGDQFFMIGASEEYRIDYDALANAILDKLTSKTYSGINNNLIDAIAALNSSLTNLRLTAVIPNTVVAVGDSVSITADARNAHSVYILIGGTWNHSFIAAVFPNNSNTPVIRNIAMYRESFDEFRIEAKDTWGLTITNVSNVSLPILVYRIGKSN